MADTTIEWTDRTWNPLRGCTRISPGCQNCYAERMAARFSGPDAPYEGLAKMTPQGPRWTGEIRLLPEVLQEPLKWRKPRRVFVNSMSDLFHEKVPDDFIDQVFGVMGQCQQHTFQILTKRPDRMAAYFAQLFREGRQLFGPSTKYDPYPNVWLGTSVENTDYKHRIAELQLSPAKIRFISFEPLLGDIGQVNLTGIHWAIAGAESGPGARPMNEDWVRSLRDQCQAAGVPFFYKQRLNERGHKVSLPELDGRQWAEWPDVGR